MSEKRGPSDERREPVEPEAVGFSSTEPPEVEDEPVSIGHTDLPGGGFEEAAGAPGGVDRRSEAHEGARKSRERAEPDLEVVDFRSIDEEPDGDEGEWDEVDDIPDLDPEQLAEMLEAGALAGDPAYLDELKLCREYEEAAKREGEIHRRELPSYMNPHDLSETGWGVIFSRDEHPAVRHHLQRLLEHRQEQAGRRYKELTYDPPETARNFLWYRHGVAPGTLDTDLMPYYLLIVGGPETIPFEFQYQLNVNHAVGRICFKDFVDYARYANSVIEAETTGVALPRRATIFSVKNDDDETTALLATHLVHPLKERLTGNSAKWEVDVWHNEKAHKVDLGRLLGGEDTPGLLLVSCHGQRFRFGHADQSTDQGALLCQDWPGKKKCPNPGRTHYFHAGDVVEDASLHGLIVFLFACYGAGTPEEDSFPQAAQSKDASRTSGRRVLAPQSFVGHLPQTLLSRGALALVGHIDRGWTLSFKWTLRQKTGDRSVETVRSLEDSIRQLLNGQRLGHAMRPLYRRYTALAAQLAYLMEPASTGEASPKESSGWLWTALNDARNFILLGDPAVYLLGRNGSQRHVGLICLDDGESDTDLFDMPIFLRRDVMRYVSEKARTKGVDVGRWVNEVLSSRARNDGFR